MARGLRSYLSLAVLITVVRLGAYAVLEYNKRTGQESISTLPLVLLLFPEAALLTPQRHPWYFALMLVIGSVLWAWVMLLLLRLVRGRR